MLCETDVTRLKEFGEYLEKMYAKDFISRWTRAWTARKGESKEYTLGKGCTINTILLQEDIGRGTAGGVVYRGRIGEWYLAGVGKRGYDRL